MAILTTDSPVGGVFELTNCNQGPLRVTIEAGGGPPPASPTDFVVLEADFGDLLPGDIALSQVPTPGFAAQFPAIVVSADVQPAVSAALAQNLFWSWFYDQALNVTNVAVKNMGGVTVPGLLARLTVSIRPLHL